MAAAGAPSADAGLHDQQEDGLTTSSTGEEDSECPLCKFIEAGPCALPHKVTALVEHAVQVSWSTIAIRRGL